MKGNKSDIKMVVWNIWKRKKKRRFLYLKSCLHCRGKHTYSIEESYWWTENLKYLEKTSDFI